MVDFGGWDMPVQYKAGTMKEHLRTRESCGLFDVSHMGEIHVDGKDAISIYQFFDNQQCRKNLLTDKRIILRSHTKNGTVVDDLLVYRFNDEKLFLVVNAGDAGKRLGVDRVLTVEITMSICATPALNIARSPFKDQKRPESFRP